MIQCNVMMEHTIRMIYQNMLGDSAVTYPGQRLIYSKQWLEYAKKTNRLRVIINGHNS
jgi:hypothetical protein